MAENRIWKWYKRHNNAINAILDIASSTIPGSGMLIGGLRLALAKWEDQAEEEQDQKAQEMEKVLNEIKPIVSDVLEEIEELESFQIAAGEEEKRKAIEQSEIKKELDRILPELGLSLSGSVSRMQVLNGKYEFLEKIGKGGQGEVYRGLHLIGQAPVAIKLLPKELDKNAISRLRTEYQRLVMNLAHPHIVQYRDLGQDESGRYFLVMDFIDGKNLRRILMEKSPMEIQEIEKLLMPVALALDFAHENKIVHRDLKPENILIRETDGRVFLTDFGLSTEILSSCAYQGKNVIDISGTLPYMSPEQYLGQPSLAATDNWALGVIVYEMLAGYHPFQGTSFEHYMKLICEIDPLKIEGLSESTWTVLQKMFDKDRKSRPQRAEEWMKELIASKVLASEKTKSRPVATSFKHFSIDKNKVEIVRQEIEIEKQKKEKIHREAEKEKKMVVQLPDTKKFEEEWKRRESKQNQREEEKKIKQPEPKKSEEKAEKEKIAIQNEKKKKWEEEQEREETWLPEGKASEGIKIPRYSLKGTEIIQDAKTRLEWLVGPDEDMNWDEAVSWVGSISTFRYGKGWRMPTKKELRAIYKSSEGRRNLSLLFKTTGWWVWAGNFPTPPLSCVFDFYSGKESRYNRSHRVCGRVFAVRDGK